MRITSQMNLISESVETDYLTRVFSFLEISFLIPSVVGGFVLRIDDQQYDASITNQLNQLERVLTLQ